MANEEKKYNTLLGVLAQKYKSKDYENGMFFPSDEIDPKEKENDPSWSLAWCKAIWSLFIRGGSYSSVDQYEYLHLLRLYGAGRQPNRIYMDLLLGQGINEGYLSTNWEIFSPAPKLHREIRGRFEQQQYDYVVNSVDPHSVAEKEQKAWEIWYNSKFKKHEDEVMKILGDNPDQETEGMYIAQSLEELELFKEMGGIKLKIEADSEKTLDVVDADSDIKTVKQKFIDDIVDFGKAAYRTYYDPISGLTKIQYVDFINLIIDYSTETDFNDIRFWAYPRLITVNELRRQSGYDEEKVKEIAIMNVGMWGNMGMSEFSNRTRLGNFDVAKGVKIYDQFRIPVLHAEWLSQDSEYKLEKKTKTGVKKYVEQEHGVNINTSNKKTKVTTITNVYQSTWVIGSDCVYDFGRPLNISRPDPKNPVMSIHAINIPGKSLMESIKPNLDQIALGFVRYQSAIAQAPPAGIDIDVSALENISLDGKSNLNVLELIKLYRQTGDTLRRSTDLNGKYAGNTGRPINPNTGGVGQFLQEIISTMEWNFRQIHEITGIDLLSSASAMRQASTATQVRYAASSTADALQPLFTAWIQAKESGAKSIMHKVMRSVSKYEVAYEAYKGRLGESAVEALKIGAEKGLSELGIKIEVRANEQMKQAAIQAATNALQPGRDGEKIDLPDWYYFVSMIERGRAKHAIAILDYRLKRSREQSIELQQENMQINQQGAEKLQQMKAQEKAMELSMEGDNDIKVAATKALLQMQVQDNDALNALKQQIIMQTLAPPQQPEMESAPPMQ